MSLTGSQTRLQQIGRRSSSRPDLTTVGCSLPRNDGALFFSGNGYHSDLNDSYVQTTTNTFTKNSMGGGGGGGMQGMTSMSVQKRAQLLYQECSSYLKRAQNFLENMAPAAEVDKNMMAAAEAMEQMRTCAVDLRNAGLSHENIVRKSVCD